MVCLVAVTLVLVAPAAAHLPKQHKPYDNCKQFNAKYPHGVGRVAARDKTSGTPITSFRRSNTLIAAAMWHNAGLDRDKDKIACEKA
jgi:Excalibur calcium-binding domain